MKFFFQTNHPSTERSWPRANKVHNWPQAKLSPSGNLMQKKPKGHDNCEALSKFFLEMFHSSCSAGFASSSANVASKRRSKASGPRRQALPPFAQRAKAYASTQPSAEGAQRLLFHSTEVGSAALIDCGKAPLPPCYARGTRAGPTAAMITISKNGLGKSLIFPYHPLFFPFAVRRLPGAACTNHSSLFEWMRHHYKVIAGVKSGAGRSASNNASEDVAAIDLRDALFEEDWGAANVELAGDPQRSSRRFSLVLPTGRRHAAAGHSSNNLSLSERCRLLARRPTEFYLAACASPYSYRLILRAY